MIVRVDWLTWSLGAGEELVDTCPTRSWVMKTSEEGCFQFVGTGLHFLRKGVIPLEGMSFQVQRKPHAELVRRASTKRKMTFQSRDPLRCIVLVGS